MDHAPLRFTVLLRIDERSGMSCTGNVSVRLKYVKGCIIADFYREGSNISTMNLEFRNSHSGACLKPGE